MASSTQAVGGSLRISAENVKRRMDAGEPVTMIDARGQKAYEASPERIPGDHRVSPDAAHANPSWPKDRLTVIYCT